MTSIIVRVANSTCGPAQISAIVSREPCRNLRNVGDLLDTYKRLKRAGIESDWPVHHGTTLSLYYADPDGNRMEFQVDCGTVQQATALMRTPAYAANPVGVLYDPDALLARFEAGEDEDPCWRNLQAGLRRFRPRTG